MPSLTYSPSKLKQPPQSSKSLSLPSPVLCLSLRCSVQKVTIHSLQSSTASTMGATVTTTQILEDYTCLRVFKAFLAGLPAKTLKTLKVFKS